MTTFTCTNDRYDPQGQIYTAAEFAAMTLACFGEAVPVTVGAHLARRTDTGEQIGVAETKLAILTDISPNYGTIRALGVTWEDVERMDERDELARVPSDSEIGERMTLGRDAQIVSPHDALEQS